MSVAGEIITFKNFEFIIIADDHKGINRIKIIIK